MKKSNQTGRIAAALLVGMIWTCPQQAAQSEPAVVIGEDTGSESCVAFTLVNSTGMDIIYLSVKDDSQIAFGDNLMQAGDTFADGEERTLFLDTDGKAQPLLMGILFDEEPRIQAILQAFPFTGEEGTAFNLCREETQAAFPGDAIIYVTEPGQAEDGFSTQEAEVKAYQDNQALYLLPDPAQESEKDADEGCIGDEGLFN